MTSRTSRRRRPAALLALLAVLTTSLLVGSGASASAQEVVPPGSDTGTVTTTPTETPTGTPTETPTETPTVTPTETPVEAPVTIPEPTPEPTPEPPPAPVFTAQPERGLATTVTWTWTQDASALAACTLHGTGTSAEVPCDPGTATVTLPSVEGDYALAVVLTGPGGTSGATSTPYALRTLPPAPEVTLTSAAGVDVAWSWAQAADATARCTVLDDAGGTVQGPEACASPFAVALPEVEGGYLLEVVLTDGDGSGPAGRSAVHLLDLPPPADFAVSGPTGHGSTADVTYAWPALGTPVCTLVSGTDRTPVPCANGGTTPLPQDGSWLLEVVQTGPGGSTTGSSDSYVLDRQAPDAPLFLTRPDAEGSGTSPTWTFTAGAPTTCATTGPTPGGGTTADPVPCDGSWTAALDGLADGLYQVTVVARDLAGNTATTTGSYRLDRAPPAAPVLTALQPSPGTGLAPSWSVDSEDPVTCVLTDDAGVELQRDTSCASPYVMPLLGRLDGRYTLTATATDAAGNTGPSATAAYLLDTTGPVVTVTGPSGAGNDPAPVWTWSADEPASSATCTLLLTTGTGTDEVSSASCLSGSVRPTLPGDGTYALRVDVADLLGTAGTATSTTYRLDATAPDLPVVSGPTGPSTATTATWTWTEEGSPTCLLSRDGTAELVDCVGSSLTTELPGSGSYVLEVVLRDAVGNVGPGGSSAPYVVDVTPPLAPVVTVATTGNSRTPAWTVTAEAGATLSCRLTAPAGTVPDWSDCTSPYVPVLDGPDGTWLLEVRATDALVNTGPAGSARHLLDTLAPDAPAVSGPLGLDNDPRPVWTWPVVPGTTATCTLLPGGTPQPCSDGAFAPALPGDGSWSASVRLTDVAGNTGDAGSSGTYVYDGTPPDPAVVTGPSGTGSAAGVSWTVTGEGTARCRLLLGSSVGGWTACTGGLSTLLDVDGSWVLEVELTDAAGNTSTSFSRPYLLDRVPPGAPTVSGPTGPSREPVVTWTVATEPGSTVECRLVGPEPSGWQSCGSSVTRTLSLDGSHVLEARLLDAARNTGPAGASAGFLLDRTAPAAPAVGGPTGPSTSRAPSWTFVLGTGASSAECALRRDGVVVQDWHSCGSPVVRDLVGSADGQYALSVRLSDVAGNVGPAGTSPPYVLDTTAPPAPGVTGPAGPSRDVAPLVAFTGEPGSSAACRAVRSGTTDATFAPCSSPWRATLQGDGTWTAEVRLTDVAGNTSDVGRSAGWVLDTVAPDVPEIAAPRSPGRDTKPTWSAVAEEGAALSCRTTSPAGAASEWAGCTFPHTTDLSAGPDGLWTLEVRATDQAGGTSDTGRATYLLDTTPPLAPVLAAPPSPSRDRLPSFGITVGPGETAACRVSRGGTSLQDWATCRTPALLDLTGLPDGAYTLTVRATDEAGGTGPVSTVTHVLDSTAPPPPVLTDLPASPNPSRRPRFSFTAEKDARTTCRVRAADDRVLRDEPCTSPWTVDLTGLPDGTYRVAFRAVDVAGNTSDPVVAGYVLDSTAPDAAVVTAPVSPASGRAPVWRITAPVAAECRLARGTAVLVDFRPCTSSYTADLAGAPDGTYVLSVRLRDAAGNLSAVTTSRYVLDTQGAAPATLTPPPSPSSSRTPAWVVTSAEDAVTGQCRVLSGTDVEADWAACPVSTAGEPFLLDLTDRADGPWTLVVRLLDAAGNVGAEQRSTYVLDTTAPGEVVVAEPGTPSPDTTPTWLLVAGQGETLECRLTSAGAVLQDWAPCTSPYTVDLTGKPDATYTLTVRAVDAAGNIGPDRTSAYRLDASAPLAPGAVVGPTGPSTDRRPTWTFVLEPGSTATCVVTRGRTTLRTGPCRSPYVLDLTGQPDGSYTVTVRAVDGAGNAGPASQVGYVLDTTAPDAPSLTLEPGSPSATTAPRWGWSTPAGATSQCRTTRGGAVLLEWAVCASPWTAALSDSPDGSYGLQVRAVDVAGNASPAVGSEYRLDRTAGLLAAFDDLPPAVGADRTPTWGLQVEQGQTLQCRLVGPDAASVFAPCGTAPAGGTRALALVGAGTYTASLTGRPDGPYVLELRSVPRGGTPGPAVRSTYRLDTTRPASAVLTAGPTGADAGTDPATAWSWDAPESTPVQCRLLRDGSALSAFAPCSSPYLVDLSTGGEASYVLELRTVDEAGNTGDVVRGAYRYDRTPPAGAVFSTRPVVAIGGRAITWSFGHPDDTTASCTVSRDGQALAEQPCLRGYVFAVGDRGAGTYVLTVVLSDAAGNVGPPSRNTWTLASGAVPPRVGDDDGSGGPVDGAGPVAGPSGPVPGRPPVPGPDSPDSAPSAPSRQGPPLPGGPGTPVLVGPQLQTVSVRRPVATVADRRVEGTLGQVERAVDRIREALPDVLSLPRPAEVPEALGRVFGETFRNAAREPTLPLTVLLVVVVFLLVQNRIDRRDPKLAAAPVEAEPELAFGPVHRPPRPDPGGATA